MGCICSKIGVRAAITENIYKNRVKTTYKYAVFKSKSKPRETIARPLLRSQRASRKLHSAD